jgi:hypothetical protein
MRAERRAKTALATSLVGFFLGAIAVPLLIEAGPFAVIPFAALIALVTLRRESRAAGGGFLVAFSAWWMYFVRQAIERCEAFKSRCEIACLGALNGSVRHGPR